MVAFARHVRNATLLPVVLVVGCAMPYEKPHSSNESLPTGQLTCHKKVLAMWVVAREAILSTPALMASKS